MEGFGTAGKMTVGAANGGHVRKFHTEYKDFSTKVRPSPRPWYANAGELKRKKRIAKYKLYGVEGKLKRSLKKGFRWIKKTCSRIVRGY